MRITMFTQHQNEGRKKESNLELFLEPIIAAFKSRSTQQL